MPSKQELQGLLGAVLRSQPDLPGPWAAAQAAGLTDEARLRAAISGRQPLNTDERRLLLRSQRARQHLHDVAAMLRADTRASWRQAGVDTQLVYQAAAAEEVRPVSVASNPDFAVSLFPLDQQGLRWTVSLSLSDRVMQGLAGPVRLVDSDGGLWLQGEPDADGELSADWALPDSPLRRLRRFRLSIEPG